MRYVFLGLMCVFAGLYAATRDRGSLGARLTVKTIASVSFVLIAFAGRVDAARPYYTWILLGLEMCFCFFRGLFHGSQAVSRFFWLMAAILLLFLFTHPLPGMTRRCSSPLRQ